MHLVQDKLDNTKPNTNEVDLPSLPLTLSVRTSEKIQEDKNELKEKIIVMNMDKLHFALFNSILCFRSSSTAHPTTH